jgi:hypothetical protein
MTRLFGVLAVLLIAGLILTAGDSLAQQQPAPGTAPAAPAPAGQEKSVEGKVKSWNPATSTMTLDDGTQISIPANVKEREKIKEGASVKASYTVTGGRNVAKSVQVE